MDDIQLLEQISPSQLPFFARYMADLAEEGESALDKYVRFPVPIEEFIESPNLLNKPNTAYPAVMDELKEINTPGKYYEVLLTGAIGAAKTFVAVYSTTYQLYLLSCLKNPHEQFGLDPASEILFVCQNKTAKLAIENAYETMRALISSAPYFQEHFRFDHKIKSKLVFANRIQIVPLSGESTAAIGQNVIGGIIDELNFMDVTQRSKRAVEGSQYDQAHELHNSISRRRKSRFMNRGDLPGILFLVSSRRYPGQFTDRVEERAKADSGVYVYDKRVWEIKPDAFSGETFRVFVGDETRKPRIIGVGEAVNADATQIIEVPVEYRQDFASEIIKAIQEIAGLSTQALYPFLMDREAVTKCFGHHRSVLLRTSVDFDAEKLRFSPECFKEPDQPRFAHVDLAISSDAAGVCIGYVPRFVEIQRGEETEKLPEIHIDCTLQVRPPTNGEISFENIRTLLYKLRAHGLCIRWVSFDSFQSTDSQQILRQKGFTTGTVSVDRTTGPYDLLKTALYDGRVKIPTDECLLRELLSLERDQVRGKVDHPPRGSKDVADALCGVVWGLTRRRRIWVKHGVSLREIPSSIRQAALTTMRSQADMGTDGVILG